MDRGALVRAEVAVALEEAFAGNAVAIGVLLAAVLVQAKLVLEELDGKRGARGEPTCEWRGDKCAP